jgi:hypothetical protein
MTIWDWFVIILVLTGGSLLVLCLSLIWIAIFNLWDFR